MRMTILAVLLLAGCASITPADTRKSKETETLHRPGALAEVAICVTHGFDDQIQTVNNLRLDESRGIGELIANERVAYGVVGMVGGSGTLYVVDFKAVDGGVDVTWHISWLVMAGEGTRNRIRKIVNSC